MDYCSEVITGCAQTTKGQKWEFSNTAAVGRYWPNTGLPVTWPTTW